MKFVEVMSEEETIDESVGGNSPTFHFKGSEIKVDKYLDIKDILDKVSEYDIFKRYCTNFVQVNKGFCSDLRSDNSPDVFIYNQHNGVLRYTDFAAGQIGLSCFDYVMRKFNIDFKTCLRVIYDDLKLDTMTYEKVKHDSVKIKTIINIVEQPYNITDYTFWAKHGISLKTLIDYNVMSCSHVFVLKGDNHQVFKSSKNNPIYAYKFVHDGQIYYKIYRPLDKFKFLFNGTIECVEGYDQLPWFGELLIITKSLKDVMAYRELGYDAISLQGEANYLKEDIFAGISRRFDRIVLNYDNDKAGIEGAEKICEKYNLQSYILPPDCGCKDLSDYIKTYGLEKAKELIISLLNAIS